jgi:hypothetical protein
MPIRSVSRLTAAQAVTWAPSGQFLAVGSYDENVRTYVRVLRLICIFI